MELPTPGLPPDYFHLLGDFWDGVLMMMEIMMMMMILITLMKMMMMIMAISTRALYLPFLTYLPCPPTQSRSGF